MIGKDDNSLGALLHDVAHLLRTVIDRKVAPYNLTRAKWLALGILDRKEGLTQTELAEELELGNATVGRLVDRLEERGFVERRPDPVDRRIKRIYISRSARPKLDKLEDIAADVRKRALNDLSRADQRRLLGYLQTIKKNLDDGMQRSVLFVLSFAQSVLPIIASV